MKKLMIVVTIACFASFMPGVASYPVTSDRYERRNGNGSGIMAPGYINIDKQRSESMKESLKQKSTQEKTTEQIGRNLDRHLTEDRISKVRPDLQKKTGSRDGTVIQNAAGLPSTSDATLNYDVAIGDGEDQVYEGDRLISEDFDEVTHYYAGFTDEVGDTLQAAVDRAGIDDIIIAKSGYHGDIMITSGVTLYGGYSADGTRDVVNTSTEIVIAEVNNVVDSVELNGFYVRTGWIIQNSSDVTLTNNICERNLSVLAISSPEQYDFASQFTAVYAENSTITIDNNTFAIVYDKMTSETTYDEETEMYTMTTVYVPTPYGTGITSVDSEIILGDNDISTGEETNLDDASKITLFESAADPTSPTDGALSDLYDISTSWFDKGKWSYGSKSAEGLGPTLTMITQTGLTTDMDANEIGVVFGNLLKNQDKLLTDMQGNLDPALIAKLVAEILRESALVGVPVGELTPQEMEIVAMLANILANPTDEQKVILDALQSLMDETKQTEGEAENPELKEAKDGFVQMIATVLLAQALPDLLKAGDVANIKGIFGELDSEKSHVLLEYRASVKTYYDSVVKELAANMALLQLKDILSKHLTKEELGQLPQTRIDEIISKMKTIKDKTVTEQEILKLEAKYRKESLEPAKRALEESMTTLLRGFSQRIFGVLDEAGLVKEEGKGGFNIDLSR